MLDGLEVVLPAADELVEALDFTGRHERERSPQRHAVTDGLWMREARVGRPGLDAATMVVLGTEGFSPTEGRVLGAHVAWSGNSVLRVERDAATGTTLGGGELLQPGEVVLAPGESYQTPWVFFAAADDGLDGLAAVWHAYQRSLDAHPGTQPVILNVWEAVYFDHDLERLQGIADRAARVGVERFVLDDGWFRSRRDDTAGLGDWWVDEDVWPDGLGPDRRPRPRAGHGLRAVVRARDGEPRQRPVPRAPRLDPVRGRAGAAAAPQPAVLDLSHPEVWDHLFERVSSILSAHPIDYVKWDHNRDLLEAGSGRKRGRRGARADRRVLPAAGRAARGTPAWPGSPAPPAAAGSTSASSSASSGCGPRT